MKNIISLYVVYVFGSVQNHANHTVAFDDFAVITADCFDGSANFSLLTRNIN